MGVVKGNYGEQVWVSLKKVSGNMFGDLEGASRVWPMPCSARWGFLTRTGVNVQFWKRNLGELRGKD